MVSIPGRDLGVLELLTKNIYSEQFEVSIPGRDLGVLERVLIAAGQVPPSKFQSLEGIWGFWN